MNKKVNTEVVIDDKEDLEISEVANFKEDTSEGLLIVLITIFVFTLAFTIGIIYDYYQKDNSQTIDKIEVSTQNSDVLITNDGDIKETITNDSFSEKKALVIEKINAIKLTTKADSEEDGVISFDIKYEILENDFQNNIFATNNSDVLVRFSYSYDKEEWTYVNNVISTSNSTLNPLMGNYYDIAGLKTVLNVATNSKLTSAPGEKKIIYWRSETTFKNPSKKDYNNNYVANFRIEYKNDN